MVASISLYRQLWGTFRHHVDCIPLMHTYVCVTVPWCHSCHHEAPYSINYVFIADIVKERGEFGWIMSTAIVITLDYQSAVILDGESFVLVSTVKILLCNVPVSLFLQLPVS